MVATPTISFLVRELEELIDDVRSLSKREKKDEVSENCHFTDIGETVLVGVGVAKESENHSKNKDGQGLQGKGERVKLGDLLELQINDVFSQ